MRNKTSKGGRVLIMAGGTGGHIFPALAIAEKLVDLDCKVHWLGTVNSMEASLVPKYGIDISLINIKGIRGKGILSKLFFPLRLFLAVCKAIGVLRNVKPRCVLGMGGYASGPGALAAYLLNIPIVLHEQNAILGMTNRYLALIATRVLEAFPGAFPEKNQALFTGNPVRADMTGIETYTPRPEKPLKLLVLGGSLGALAINELVPKAVSLCADSIEVWHQAGNRHLASTKALYENSKHKIKVEGFINDISEAYEWADLVLCRSGALTVAELAQAGRASILVPFPFAVDDHQTNNAKYLTEQKAAVCVQQKYLTIEKLVSMLNQYNSNRQLLASMATKASSQTNPLAAEQIAKICLEVDHAR